MSAPIAGRRKAAAGVGTSSPPPPAAASSDLPDWLMGDTPAAANPAQLPTVVPSQPNRSTDPLDFLSFDSGPVAPPPAAPHHLSTPGATMISNTAPPQQAARQPPARSDPLDFLNFDDDVQPSVPPQPTYASAAVPTAVPKPAAGRATLGFLDFDDEAPAPTARSAAGQYSTTEPDFLAVDTTGSASRGGGASSTLPTAASVDVNYEKKMELVQELARLSAEIHQSESVIASFADETNPLCMEVKGLRTELKALEDKREEQKKQREEGDRVAAHAEEQEKSLHAAELERCLGSYKAECAEQCKEEVAKLQKQIAESEAALARQREAVDEMRENAAQMPAEMTAARDLETRLVRLIADVRNDFSNHAKPLLRRTLQEEFFNASQQRQDIVLQDRQTRKNKLLAFRDQRDKELDEFARAHRRRLSDRSDQIFGKMKAWFESEAQARKVRAQERLDSYRKEILATSEESYAKAQTGLEKGRRVSFGALDMQKMHFLAEERALLAKRETDLDVFRRRLAEEKRCVLATHRTRFPPESAGAQQAASSFTMDPNRIENAVRSSVEHIQERIRQLQYNVATDVQLLRSSVPVQTKRNVLRDKEAQVQQLKEKADGNMKQLSSQLVRLRQAVTPCGDVVARLDQALRAKRVQLISLHESSTQTFKRWSEDVRRELARTCCQRSTNEEDTGNTFLENTLAHCLNGIAEHVELHRIKEDEVRALRRTMVERVGRGVDSFQGIQTRTNTNLARLLQLYDALHRTNTEVESQRALLEAAAGEYEATAKEVGEERDALNMKRQDMQEQVRDMKRLVMELGHLGVPVPIVPLQDITRAMAAQSNQHTRRDKKRTTAPAAVSHGGRVEKGEQRGNANVAAAPQQQQQQQQHPTTGGARQVVPRVSVPFAPTSPSPVKPFSQTPDDPYWPADDSVMDDTAACEDTDFSTNLIPLDDDDTDTESALARRQRDAQLKNRPQGHTSVDTSDAPTVDNTGFARSSNTDKTL